MKINNIVKMKEGIYMNKTQAAYEKDKIIYVFIGECCGPEILSYDVNVLEQEYEEYKESLDEINCMILYNQDLGNTEEISA